MSIMKASEVSLLHWSDQISGKKVVAAQLLYTQLQGCWNSVLQYSGIHVDATHVINIQTLLFLFWHIQQ